MIPGWKIRRELGRFTQQLRAIPESLWEPVIYGRYDRRFPAELTILDGTQPQTARVALVLIFPGAQLAQSTVSLCEGLARAGYAPLVVSNAPLTAENAARLKAVVWRLVQRPNLGYDFGGYRDGIRLLWHWGLTPERLLILNDSVWLWENDPAPLIARLEATEADVTGSILREKGDVRFLESYCYLIRQRAFEHPAFRGFWQGLRLTSNKYKVIRRGERGHSAALFAAGLTLRPAYTAKDCLDLLEQMTEARLADVLRYAAFATEAEQAAAQALLAQPAVAHWRADALALCRQALVKGQFYSLFPVAARDMGYPFLKRSGDRVAVLWRRACLDAIHAGVISPAHPVVMAELAARVAKDV